MKTPIVSNARDISFGSGTDVLPSYGGGPSQNPSGPLRLEKAKPKCKFAKHKP